MHNALLIALFGSHVKNDRHLTALLVSQVRAAAYQALAAYPMDLLETLEALRPLQNCVQRLMAETDARGRAECEVLVGKALAHEHMRRRRWGLLFPHAATLRVCCSHMLPLIGFAAPTCCQS